MTKVFFFNFNGGIETEMSNNK